MGLLLLSTAEGHGSAEGHWTLQTAEAHRLGRYGVRYSFFFMRADAAQLKTLAALYDAGVLRPVLDRTFPFGETLDAMAYVEQGRAKGKIVVTMPFSRA